MNKKEERKGKILELYNAGIKIVEISERLDAVSYTHLDLYKRQIQTYNPQSFAIQCASKQNYEKFYETEIALRKQLKYPPFCDIILIGFNSYDENEIKNVSNNMYNKIINQIKGQKDEENFKIFRPMPCPIDKIQNRYRWRIIIKGNMTEEMNSILNNSLKEIYQENIKDTRITIDVNPNNMS